MAHVIYLKPYRASIIIGMNKRMQGGAYFAVAK